MRLKLDGTYIGIDVGQQRDYTALSVVEKRIDPIVKTEYHVRQLARLPLKLDYTAQVDRIVQVVQELRDQSPVILVDVGGVGRPFLDLLINRGVPATGIQITGGDTVREGNAGSINVPKRDLVLALELAFEQKRIKIPESLKQKDILISELQNFTVKISSSGHDSYAAAKESIHDDMIIALALPVWYSERGSVASFEIPPEWIGFGGQQRDSERELLEGMGLTQGSMSGIEWWMSK
jgi:hypothetical protein